MLVMDDAGLARLQKRYAAKDDWVVEVSETHVTLYEMIGNTRCLHDKWERVDDARKHVSFIRR